MKLRYIFFCLLIALFSCTENINPPNIPGQDTCSYIAGSSDDPWAASTVWQTRAYNFTRPCFNPTNADEFAYIRYEQEWLENGNYELRKHTISTNQDIPVCSLNAKTALISWDMTGWIFFVTLVTMFGGLKVMVPL